MDIYKDLYYKLLGEVANLAERAEKIQADAGLDIGLTLIGMHLKPVAVPLRLTQKTIGEALTGADFVIISIMPGTFDDIHVRHAD
jgi:hypothetical protein